MTATSEEIAGQITVSDALDSYSGLSDRELIERTARAVDAQGAQLDWLCQQAAPLFATLAQFAADPSAAIKMARGAMLGKG